LLVPPLAAAEVRIAAAAGVSGESLVTHGCAFTVTVTGSIYARSHH
jgi:hypothetical protein